MDTYKISYFAFRGRAEVARYLLGLSKVEYIDDRFSFEDYDKRKQAGDFAANFGRVPILTYNGVEYGQSKAIERFLAKKFGFFGQSETEALQVDVICEHARDIKDVYASAREGKSGDELQAAKNAFVANTLPGWFTKVESSLGSTGYAVGSSPSLADLYMFHLAYDYFDANKAEVEALVQSYPKLKACADTAKELLKDYLAKRPVTPW
jgi:glutathione S-transferase